MYPVGYYTMLTWKDHPFNLRRRLVRYAKANGRKAAARAFRCGIDLGEVVIQTDRGSEFDGNTLRVRDRGFDHTVEGCFGATHRRIPNPNYNADVETFHNLIELELFDIEPFRGRRDFFEKVTTYQHYFNLARGNSYKGWRTPLELLAEAEPRLPPSVLLLPPLDLDKLAIEHVRGDDDLPALPARHISGA